MAININSVWQQHLEAAKSACARGDYSSGEQELKRALDTAADQQAPERDVAEIFHYIGWCLHAQQRLPEALRSYGQSLASYERCCGTTSAEASTVLQSIARALSDVGQKQQSQVMYERALSIAMKLWGPDHDYTRALQKELAEVAAQVTAAPPVSETPAQKPAATVQAASEMAPHMVQDGSDSRKNFTPLSSPVAPQPQPAPEPEKRAEPVHSGKRRLPRSISDDDELDETAYQPATERRQSLVQATVIVDELVHPREKFYGTLAVVIGVVTYLLCCLFIVGLFVAPLFILGAYISGGMHLGALRGRGIKVTEEQFPEIWTMVQDFSRQLNIPQPETYIVCEDGILNAYARRFHRRDYIMISSDVAEIAYEKGPQELAFVVAHELGHVKRGHCKWAWLHIPASLIPFYGNAYSRACEYTCDRIAQALVPDGALYGLVSLAAGTKLYKNVNLKELYKQSEREWGFWTWFSEIQATHPNLMNRIRAIGIADAVARRAFEKQSSRG
jgi:Zn-dependent protease with chaperone function